MSEILITQNKISLTSLIKAKIAKLVIMCGRAE